MPTKREAREPVPRITNSARAFWPWVPDISLIAKFRDDSGHIPAL
jgi:hypothetical protein